MIAELQMPVGKKQADNSQIQELWLAVMEQAVSDFRWLVRHNRVAPHPEKWAIIPEEATGYRYNFGYNRFSEVRGWKGKRDRGRSLGSGVGLQEAEELLAFFRPGGPLEWCLQLCGLEDYTDKIREQLWNPLVRKRNTSRSVVFHRSKRVPV